MMKPDTRTPGKLSFSTSPRSAVASWILTGIALFLVLKLHLLSALLAGLLIHELVRLLAPLVEKRLSSKGARLVALATPVDHYGCPSHSVHLGHIRFLQE